MKVEPNIKNDKMAMNIQMIQNMDEIMKMKETSQEAEEEPCDVKMARQHPLHLHAIAPQTLVPVLHRLHMHTSHTLFDVFSLSFPLLPPLCFSLLSLLSSHLSDPRNGLCREKGREEAPPRRRHGHVLVCVFKKRHRRLLTSR